MEKKYDFSNELNLQKIREGVSKSIPLVDTGLWLLNPKKPNQDYKITSKFEGNKEQQTYKLKAENFTFNDSAIFNNSETLPTISFLESQYFNQWGELATTELIDFYVADIQVSKAFKMIDTNPINCNGEITEYLGAESYNINLSLLIIENLTTKPDLLLEKLIRTLSITAPINVKSRFLENYGISQIKIKSFNNPIQNEKKNYYTISIQAKSHESDLDILEGF